MPEIVIIAKYLIYLIFKFKRAGSSKLDPRKTEWV